MRSLCQKAFQTLHYPQTSYPRSSLRLRLAWAGLDRWRFVQNFIPKKPALLSSVLGALSGRRLWAFASWAYWSCCQRASVALSWRPFLASGPLAYILGRCGLDTAERTPTKTLFATPKVTSSRLASSFGDSAGGCAPTNRPQSQLWRHRSFSFGELFSRGNLSKSTKVFSFAVQGLEFSASRSCVWSSCTCRCKFSIHSYGS